jgi:hypothetical protein
MPEDETLGSDTPNFRYDSVKSSLSASGERERAKEKADAEDNIVP